MCYSEAHSFLALDKISFARAGLVSDIVCVSGLSLFLLSWTTWNSDLLSSSRCSPLMTMLRAMTVVLLTMGACLINRLWLGVAALQLQLIRVRAVEAALESQPRRRRIARDACGDLKRSLASVKTLKAKEEETEHQTTTSPPGIPLPKAGVACPASSPQQSASCSRVQTNATRVPQSAFRPSFACFPCLHRGSRQASVVSTPFPCVSRAAPRHGQRCFFVRKKVDGDVLQTDSQHDADHAVPAAQDVLLRVSRGGRSGKLFLESSPEHTALMESLDSMCAAGVQDPVWTCRAWLLLRGVRWKRGVCRLAEWLLSSVSLWTSAWYISIAAHLLRTFDTQGAENRESSAPWACHNEGRHAALPGPYFLRALASEEGVAGLTLAETRMSDFMQRLLNRDVALTADIMGRGCRGCSGNVGAFRAAQSSTRGCPQRDGLCTSDVLCTRTRSVGLPLSRMKWTRSFHMTLSSWSLHDGCPLYQVMARLLMYVGFF